MSLFYIQFDFEIFNNPVDFKIFIKLGDASKPCNPVKFPSPLAWGSLILLRRTAGAR